MLSKILIRSSNLLFPFGSQNMSAVNKSAKSAKLTTTKLSEPIKV